MRRNDAGHCSGSTYDYGMAGIRTDEERSGCGQQQGDIRPVFRRIVISCREERPEESRREVLLFPPRQEGAQHLDEDPGQAVLFWQERCCSGRQPEDSRFLVYLQCQRTAASRKTKTVKVKGIRYRVKKSGKAAPGWDSARTYCFGKNGRILCSSWSPDGKYYLGKNGRKYTGIHVIAGISGSAQKEGKFYIFGANGKLKQEKTRQIQLVSRYEDEMTALYRWIGSPLRADYASGSCYKAPNGDTGGRDGVLTYSNFTIYTYRTSDGSAEYFLGAESR